MGGKESKILPIKGVIWTGSHILSTMSYRVRSPSILLVIGWNYRDDGDYIIRVFQMWMGAICCCFKCLTGEDAMKLLLYIW